MATIFIPNSPSNLTMNDFRAVSDDFGGLAKSCRFAAVIRPQGSLMLSWAGFARDLMYLTEVTELPGRGFMNIDVRYYGPNQKLPFQSTYEDIGMTFLCRNDSFERQFIDDWMLMINPVNTFDFSYRDDYQAEIDLYQFTDYGYEEPEVSYNMTLHNAYPILLNPQPVAWQDDQIQRLVVSFTYTSWSRYGLDPVPGSFDLVTGRDGGQRGQ